MSTKGFTVRIYIIKAEKKVSDLPICPTCKKCEDIHSQLDALKLV